MTRNTHLAVLHKRHKGRCYYCATETYIVKLPVGAMIPDNAATIEHLYHKMDIRRLLQRYNNDNTVLSCRKCNETRGNIKNMQKQQAQRPARFYDIRVFLTNNL